MKPITFRDVIDSATASDTDSSNPTLYAIRRSDGRWVYNTSETSSTSTFGPDLHSALWLPKDKAENTRKRLRSGFPNYGFDLVRISGWKTFKMWMRCESR